MIPAVEALGGEIVECAVLVDRSGGRETLTSPSTGRTYPLRALWQLDLPTYEPGRSTCPRCAAGDSARTPRGARGLRSPPTADDLAPPGRVDRRVRVLASRCWSWSSRSRSAWRAPSWRGRRPGPALVDRRHRRRRFARSWRTCGASRCGCAGGELLDFDLRRARERDGRSRPAICRAPGDGRNRSGSGTATRADQARSAWRTRLGLSRASAPLRDPAATASSSSSLKISMSDAVTIPSLSTTKTQARSAAAIRRVASARWRRRRVRTGWSWPSTTSSWYGSTLMNVTSGARRRSA